MTKTIHMPKDKLSELLPRTQLGKDMTNHELIALVAVLEKWEAKGVDFNGLIKVDDYVTRLDEIEASNNDVKNPDDLDFLTPADFLYGTYQDFLSEIKSENSWLKNVESTPLTRLQVSVSESTHHLLSCWSIAEGQPITSCLRLALEKGLRQMKKDGELPESACESYENQCRKRIMFAELQTAMTMGVSKIFDSNEKQKK